MLDHCSISHKGGAVIWSRSFTPAASQLAASPSSPVNSLVREALIEGRTAENKYEKDGYSIKWTFANELDLIFVVAYQRILQLTYIEDLLSAVKALFMKMFQPFLVAFVASLRGVTAEEFTIVQLRDALSGWDKLFDKLLKGIEDKAAQDRKSRLRPATRFELTPSPPLNDDSTTPTQSTAQVNDAQEISRNIEALKSRLKGRPSPGGKRRGKGGKGGLVDSPSGTDTDTGKRKASKSMRKWGDSVPTESDMSELDFSSDRTDVHSSPANVSGLVDSSSLGTRRKDGIYEVKDLNFAGTSDGDEGEDEDDIISRALEASAVGKDAPAAQSTLSSTFGGLFARLTGSKVITTADLEPVLNGMREHLMKKNVAKEIADKVCEGVGENLIGKKVGGFNSIKSEVRTALSNSITRILTPKTSTDLLLSIRTKLATGAASTSLSASKSKRAPYTITFVGVNGVGKSTNLSKVAFWLLQNEFKVLIAACDTFRSGAVEQLRVHVRNLGALVGEGKAGKGAVELYERGYGKDAAGIAKEAIAYAQDTGFDVVLIDTAGRMQDNEPLMRALAKLVSTNNPDKIIFVGEALVGNEAVDQLTKFDRALKDFSASAGKGRGIDGMLITKWDTVDDKVGAALSMTYVTGQPILFVGCGQTYTDLRQLRVAHILQALLKD